MSQFIVFNPNSPSGGGTVLSLTGNDSLSVVPTGGGTINVVGDGVTLTTTRNGANTMLISIDGESANTVTTNDANATTIASFSLAGTGEAVTVTATIIGTKADFSAACGGTAFVVARRQAAMGAAPLIAVNAAPSEDSTTGNPSFQVVLVGNDILFQVIGESATVYNWKVLLRFVNLT
jgi:hypothetical protein